MRRWLGAAGLVLVCLVNAGCQNETPPTAPTTIINNTNTNTVNLPGGGGTVPSPGTQGPCLALHLGCDSMVGPNNQPLPGCGAQLADYTGPVGTRGRLDATPVGSGGVKLQGMSVDSWAAVGSCSLSGIVFGTDGFNPDIHLDSPGECIVSVAVTGCEPASRKFIGQ